MGLSNSSLFVFHFSLSRRQPFFTFLPFYFFTFKNFHPLRSIRVMQRCYAYLCRSLAVVVAVVDEERVFGFYASLLKGLYEDLRVGLGQMHGAREEDLIEIIVHAILMSLAVTISKEVVGTLVPMHKIGVGEQIDTMSAFAES